jgi:hypothetical protein
MLWRSKADAIDGFGRILLDLLRQSLQAFIVGSAVCVRRAQLLMCLSFALGRLRRPKRHAVPPSHWRFLPGPMPSYVGEWHYKRGDMQPTRLVWSREIN